MKVKKVWSTPSPGEEEAHMYKRLIGTTYTFKENE